MQSLFVAIFLLITLTAVLPKNQTTALGRADQVLTFGGAATLLTAGIIKLRQQYKLSQKVDRHEPTSGSAVDFGLYCS